VVNAALAIVALTNSPLFNLEKTYFLIAGIAGVNPKTATLGSVCFAKYAVQVDLQYEFDAREIPLEWSTGYVPQGAASPDAYPPILYGTEVFELNDSLREEILPFARTASLKDSEAAIAYRAKFADQGNAYQPATGKPSIVKGDIASANVFFHGHLLSEAMEKYFKLITGGRGEYSMTCQEDTATLGALLRAALNKQVDFSRIIIQRTGSNFDRPFSRTSMSAIPLHANHGGFEPSIENIWRAGIKVVQGILDHWSERFENGIPPKNYIGDIFGSLGGDPDFGPGRRIPLQ
jgi:purine nucleoside permease